MATHGARDDEVAWDERGLAPAIVQDARTGSVLMLAWMNAEALARTRATGFVHFYSRSRQAPWKKGETSGNTLAAREIRADCDRDAVLVRAEPAGPTCHTGARSCFFRPLAAGNGGGADVGGPREDDGPAGAPAAVVDRIYDALVDRRDHASAEESYTASLLAAGAARILAKIREETEELAAEIDGGPPERIVAETADVLYHLLVGLVARGVAPAAVWAELGRRFGVSGHAEKAARARPHAARARPDRK